MSGISGFCSFDINFNDRHSYWKDILTKMITAMTRRGNDKAGEYLNNNIGISQTNLIVRDLVNGVQPITKVIDGVEYVIAFNGEIYNMAQLKNDLISKGYIFETTTDAEVVLYAHIEYGVKAVDKLNGIFAYAIWHGGKKQLYLFRDRCGIKPLFYTLTRNSIIFGSELKALFEHPCVTAQIDNNSLREIFGLGPARTEGSGVFKNIFEVKYGHYVVYDLSGFKEIKYWELKSEEYTKKYEEAIDDVKYLVTSAVEYQTASDIDICSFLSGGLDSCVVTAIASNYAKSQGKNFSTFSFDFTDNDIHFKSSSFQPEQDRPYVDKMLSHFDLNHSYLECNETDLADYLYLAVDAKDLPGMGDIDASMLYFCNQVSNQNKVALTGECADEIFGGYPWFHREDFINAKTFPWSINQKPRLDILNNEFKSQLNINNYIQMQYDKSILEVPILESENKLEKRRREISYLNLKWFMTTLLYRMDRASTYFGLEARVPFADHRIIEYMWNVPWEYKCHDGIVKGLLRDSAKGLLPDELLYRKKSPYPKTYNPNYEKILKQKVRDIISNSNSPINNILNKDNINLLLNSPADYGKPWFGQLMAAPQMLAYIIQVNYWLKKYNLSI